MRLIHTERIELYEFIGSNIPEYAILSHCWAEDEISFQEFKTGLTHNGPGLRKILDCCRIARENGLNYIWIDTCCIDKTSSAELSEAINSMFGWYERSAVCYAFLNDVDLHNDRNTLPESPVPRWFTRGWTLQEMLAPPEVVFYDRNLRKIGSRDSLVQSLTSITGIDPYYLLRKGAFRGASIAQRMSWAANRLTSRIEDVAYCLLGLFDLKMPLLYGEGRQAFLRLQEQIIAQSNDESIFAWVSAREGDCGLLAEWPSDFAKSGNIRQLESVIPRPLFGMTSKGLDFHIPSIGGDIWDSELLSYWLGSIYVPLYCEDQNSESPSNLTAVQKRSISIKVRRVPALGESMWCRSDASELYLHQNVFQAGQLSAFLHGYNTIFLPSGAQPDSLDVSGDLDAKRFRSSFKRLLLSPTTIGAIPAVSTQLFMFVLCFYPNFEAHHVTPDMVTWMQLAWGWRLCRYSDMYLFGVAVLLLFSPRLLTYPGWGLFLAFMQTLPFLEFLVVAGVQITTRRSSPKSSAILRYEEI